MNKKQRLLCEYTDQSRDLIARAEKTIWENPELGYTEWKTHAYLKEEFEKLGYAIVEAGNIPGFYADIDTGRPGPKVLLSAEMDALLQPTHMSAIDGKAHACGHHAQCAALLGVAYALTQPGALDGLCGSIRLMAVPAEELGSSNLEYRYQMIKDGIIHFTQGKLEFMDRGLFDDVDIGMMVHTTVGDTHDFRCDAGCNAIMYKNIVFSGTGKLTNAVHAVNLALNGINALWENYPDDQYIWVRPTVKASGKTRSELTLSIRCASLAVQEQINNSIDRVLVGAAIASGTTLELFNNPGCAPMVHPQKLMDLVQDVCGEIVGPDRVKFQSYWNRGGADMGDVSQVLPSIHLNACGGASSAHSDRFYIADLDRACVNSAKAQLLTLQCLLENNAEKAKEIIDDFAPRAIPVTEYLAQRYAVAQPRKTEFFAKANELTISLKA